MRLDRPALLTIRDYLDDMLYALVDLRLLFELQPTPTGFPRFQDLNAIVQGLDPTHQVIHRLLRLGSSVPDAEVQRTIPAAVLNAFVEAQILSRSAGGEWKSTGCLLLPIDGLLVFAGIPPSYPTSGKASRPWFDLSSFVLARALPTSLDGDRVLDICSGSGVQALLCARRGATSLVGLEIDPEAVDIARANAIFSGLETRVEFRVSNGLAALRDDERFDFVVCNTPYAPTLSGPAAPASPAEVGNAVLMGLLGELPHYLSSRGRGVLGLWRTIGPGAWTYHRRAVTEQLARHGFTALAFVDRAPDTPESVIRIVQADLNERPTTIASSAAIEMAVRAMLLQDRSAEGFFNEVITFRRGRGISAMPGAVFGLTSGMSHPDGQDATPKVAVSAVGGS